MLIRSLICTIWLMLMTVPARAVTPTEFTQLTLERAAAIMASHDSRDEELAKLSIVFNGFLDTDSMGRAALSDHWTGLRAAQQREFLTLFHVFIERAFVEKLMLFENPRFDYVDELRQGQFARVTTRIVTPADEFSVVYRLRRENDRWMATGIAVEGVDLTANYAAQFNHLLAHSSIEDVLALMRRKYGSNAEAQR